MVRRAVPHVYRMRASVLPADVDAFGELRGVALLRFLQEAATRASTDAGFPPAFYERQRTFWLVRRTTLVLLAPIRSGDELEATTWIADFRRVRSRRDYEVRGGAGLLARASTDWVYVDRAAARPRRIPAEIQAAFAVEGAPALARAPFPAPAPPCRATRSLRRVELHHLDALQHVNNAVYLHYVEASAADAHGRLGWPLAAQLASGGRFRAVAHDLEYLEAARHGDELQILGWPAVVADDGIERHTVITRGTPARPLLRAISRYQWVGAARGASRPMPEALRAALAAA
jgi:acyl-CoA thioester hydrolase